MDDDCFRSELLKHPRMKLSCVRENKVYERITHSAACICRFDAEITYVDYLSPQDELHKQLDVVHGPVNCTSAESRMYICYLTTKYIHWLVVLLIGPNVQRRVSQWQLQKNA